MSALALATCLACLPSKGQVLVQCRNDLTPFVWSSLFLRFFLKTAVPIPCSRLEHTICRGQCEKSIRIRLPALTLGNHGQSCFRKRNQMVESPVAGRL